ncbi:hypothetical protein [Vreelandella subglaciescola]|jgi:hypothetical protein|uniref:Uncharacterized protein n=1 Tax=Vreelandella subglaciescola TaxID=29571 RepID=A0A1M7IGL6_9GAMM|nr:hypothetical protein [Halomonas subglaciescola]SHM39986.1 hypothetical protein SAMN05878437_2759 [Halomonas subglaciescola]
MRAFELLIRIFLYLTGSALQCLAFWQWLFPASLPQAVPYWPLYAGNDPEPLVLVYVAGAFLQAISVCGWGRLREKALYGRFLCVVLVMLALPIVGSAGVALIILSTAFMPRDDSAARYTSYSLPGLMNQEVEPPALSSQALREGLASVLTSASDPRRRQKALLQAQHLPLRRAVALMRIGVGDDADEVRLLGYSMLDRLERRLETELGHLRKRLEKEGDPLGNIHVALASLCGEYAYLELTQGKVREAMLDEAISYQEKAIAVYPCAERWKYYARLSLERGYLENADYGLAKAREFGLASARLHVFEAEIAYKCRDIKRLKKVLAHLTASQSLPPVLRRPLEYWQCTTPG